MRGPDSVARASAKSRCSWLTFTAAVAAATLLVYSFNARNSSAGPPASAAKQTAAVALACKPVDHSDAAMKAMRQEYQTFLLEDAAKFQMEVMDWAGYAGPWIENTFLRDWKRLQAQNVDMGDRLYVPLMFCDCFHHCTQEQKLEIKEYLMKLKMEYKYFSVTQLDKGLQYSEIHVPPGLDLLLFSSGSTTRGVRTVPLPLLKKELQPAGLEKTIGINFYGDLDTHKIRRDVEEQLKDQGYQFGRAGNEETFEVIERSNFTLAPRGHGSTSFRMFEALQLLSVPIFVWDYDPFLPFQELLDWNDISIIVHRREIGTIPQRVAAFDLEKAKKLMVQNQHLWTYKFNSEYIVDRLQKEGCFPVPFSFYTDIPGRE